MKTMNLFNSGVAEVEILYHNTVPTSQMRQISSSKDANDILRFIWSNSLQHIEEFYILLLNCSNKVLGYAQISKGGISSCVVDPKVIFQTALKTNATGIILAHNHPSGSLSPSDADRKLTNKIKSAGSFLDINVLDHLIMTDNNFYSFADEGIM